jgi:SAM-dependent methyltransferase
VIDRAGREPLLRRLGLLPHVADLLREALGVAIDRAEADHDRAGHPRPAVTALDAGCGRRSALASFRPRLARVVGVDVHRPAGGASPSLDSFVTADLCCDRSVFGPATFDLALSSFAVEHLADPAAAMANVARWLRPGGTLVVATVNQRHPFVAAYLRLPDGVRRRLQPLVKASAGDAHPLVGACNDPAALRTALVDAGFTDVELRMVGNLARAWGRRLPTFALGVAGDLLARGMPARRSTIVATARIPEADRTAEPGP